MSTTQTSWSGKASLGARDNRRLRHDPADHHRHRPRPNGIAFDPATHTIYTANALDATVSTVNLSPEASGPPRASCPKSPSAASPERSPSTRRPTRSTSPTPSTAHSYSYPNAGFTQQAQPAQSSPPPRDRVSPLCAASAPGSSVEIAAGVGHHAPKQMRIALEASDPRRFRQHPEWLFCAHRLAYSYHFSRHS